MSIVLPERDSGRFERPIDQLVFVSATSPPQGIANTIFRALFDQGMLLTLRAVGAGAVCQACKGIAIARGQVAVRGLDLGTSIGFDHVEIQGKDRSAQTFTLFLR